MIIVICVSLVFGGMALTITILTVMDLMRRVDHLEKNRDYHY